MTTGKHIIQPEIIGTLVQEQNVSAGIVGWLETGSFQHTA